MANIMFQGAATALWNGNIDWPSDDIRAILIDTASWTPDATADVNLNDVPGGARVATSSSLVSKSVSAGSIDAADLDFESVTGVQSEAVVIYKHTGSEATSTLIFYFDSMSGLPVTPSGDDITVRWNASGIAGL